MCNVGSEKQVGMGRALLSLLSSWQRSWAAGTLWSVHRRWSTAMQVPAEALPSPSCPQPVSIPSVPLLVPRPGEGAAAGSALADGTGSGNGPQFDLSWIR